MGKSDAQGKPIAFSLKYVKRSTGEIIFIEQAVMTSNFHLGTINIKILPSGEIRKIILPLILEFNNTPVFI